MGPFEGPGRQSFLEAPETLWLRVRNTPSIVRVLLLLAYGAAIAALALSLWDVSRPDLMSSRASDIGGSIRALEAGGPPLLNCSVATQADLDGGDFAGLIEGGGCWPAGYTDDQGLALFVPYVARAADTTDPSEALRMLYLASLALLITLYPLIFRAVMGTTSAAIVAPLLILGLHPGLTGSDGEHRYFLDHYWIVSWGLLLGLPLAMAAYRNWQPLGRWRWALLGVISILGSYVSAMRIHAGLPLVIACLIVIAFRAGNWKSRVGLAALSLVAYLAIYPFGLEAAREYRDRSVGDRSLSDRYPERHPLWHNAYIGLGVIPNDYGIRWDDSVSATFVRETDPSAAYLSPEYEKILRDEYFRLLVQDPGFVLRSYLFKADKVVRSAFSTAWPALVLIPLSVAIGRRRREMRRYVILAAPALFLGAIPPVMTHPDLVYQMGWLGALSVFYVVGVAWAVSEVVETVRRRKVPALPSTSIQRPARRVMASPWTWSFAAFGAVLLAIVALRGVFPPPEESHDAYYVAGATQLSDVEYGQMSARWDFAGGSLAGWEPTGGATVERVSDGLDVITGSGRSHYQLVGPPVDLPAGLHALRLEGGVLDGGLELGVLDAERETWIETAHFWSGQAPFSSGMVAAFQLERPTTVRPILANWAPEERASRWTIRELSLSRKRTGG